MAPFGKLVEAPLFLVFFHVKTFLPEAVISATVVHDVSRCENTNERGRPHALYAGSDFVLQQVAHV